jgi:hypothetical protein
MGEQPNVPQQGPMSALPISGRRIEPQVMTQTDMIAADPNTPRVRPHIPEGLYPSSINMGQPAAPGSMPPLYNMENDGRAAVPPEFDAQQHNPMFQQPEAAPRPSHAQAAGFVPPTPSERVPQPQPGRVAGSHQLPSQPLMHPVLESLMQDFGLTEANAHEFEWRGHHYRMLPLTAELMGFCTSIASRTSQSNDEYMYRLALIMGIVSLVAIDGVPCSELFKSQVAGLKIAYDPFNPPYAVRVKFAPSLLEIFSAKLRILAAQKIAEEYDTAFDESSDMVAAAKKAEETKPVGVVDERVHFKCSVDGCGFVENVVPEYLDAASGAIKPRFCPSHGPTMTPVAYTRDLGDAPLE